VPHCQHTLQRPQSVRCPVAPFSTGHTSASPTRLMTLARNPWTRKTTSARGGASSASVCIQARRTRGGISSGWPVSRSQEYHSRTLGSAARWPQRRTDLRDAPGPRVAPEPHHRAPAGDLGPLAGIFWGIKVSGQVDAHQGYLVGGNLPYHAVGEVRLVGQEQIAGVGMLDAGQLEVAAAGVALAGAQPGPAGTGTEGGQAEGVNAPAELGVARRQEVDGFGHGCRPRWCPGPGEGSGPL
jgi:hypothetical protein